MGANFNMTVITAENEAELMEKFKHLQDHCKQQFGTDPYNGTWSTLYGVQLAPDEDLKGVNGTDAIEGHMIDLCEEYGCDKWGNALAVKTDKGYVVGGWCAE